ncbi:helix-turn-helix transcriptional regulator [Chromobacterium sp. CV08]|uniref:helix-turn-helix transcriptional regulator n=1 Tax=Chromobacterium sp. CV08 TaxID=3133274 RepID=UPI003DA7CA95
MDEKLIEVLSELSKKIESLGAHVPVDKAIWSPATCAQYLGVSERHFAERLALKPGFPEPFNISAGERNLVARYRAKDIIAWVERQRVRRVA